MVVQTSSDPSDAEARRSIVREHLQVEAGRRGLMTAAVAKRVQCNAMQCSGLSWNWGGGKAAQSCEEWPKDRETVQENETRRRKEGSLEWKNIETRRTTSEPAKTQ
mmetsp:Transcript_62993/g.132945  ORF Transcript_62993/g.132945 Transcript_62993/m.132945 type:complete len:106 (+) Transcript_62993:507-824(+)